MLIPMKQLSFLICLLQRTSRLYRFDLDAASSLHGNDESTTNQTPYRRFKAHVFCMQFTAMSFVTLKKGGGQGPQQRLLGEKTGRAAIVRGYQLLRSWQEQYHHHYQYLLPINPNLIILQAVFDRLFFAIR
jgi:hypothetical protein